MWGGVFSFAGIESFNRMFDLIGSALLLVAAAIFGIVALVTLMKGISRDKTKAGAMVLRIGSAIVVAAIALVIGLGRQINISTGAGPSGGLSWALLVAVSVLIRRLLVQFVGDVAIYVAPYKLDQFFALRAEIKDAVLNVVRRVYKMPGHNNQPYYDRVVLVAHSLGTVVTYDALNALIREEAAGTLGATVVARTPLFLTFGSPLDKIAFIFAGQATAKGTVEAREALAVTKQPMIADYNYRPAHWINVFSRWDIISGSLDFYDSLKNPHPTKSVENREDIDATTLLSAHTEYWRNGSLLFAKLYSAI
jgi:hypothetical protein